VSVSWIISKTVVLAQYIVEIFAIALNKKAGGFLKSYGFVLEMFGAILVLLLGSFLLLSQY